MLPDFITDLNVDVFLDHYPTLMDSVLVQGRLGLLLEASPEELESCESLIQGLLLGGSYCLRCQ
jgi:hypothetical protein